MKMIQVEIPEKTAAELQALIQQGWFTDESEVVRAALREYLRTHHLELVEQFQREDIRWALDQAQGKK